jgi:hypothetical protein
MVQHAREGSLANITDSQLEAWATWHGKRGAFAAFFREQLCDEAGIVRAWEEYNGRSIRRAEAAKERSRAYREQQERERHEARTEREQNANRTHTQTHTVRRTRPDLTVPKDITASGADAPAPADVVPVLPAVRRTRTQTAPPPDPSWVAVGVAWWVPNVGEITHGRFGKALKNIVATFEWEPVFADIQQWVAEQKASGKGRGKGLKLEWYAEVASARLTTDEPPMWDYERKCLTDYGELRSRPDHLKKVSA